MLNRLSPEGGFLFLMSKKYKNLQMNTELAKVDEKSMALYLKQLASFLLSLQKEGVFNGRNDR